MANFERDKPGQRLLMGGIDLVHPVDLLPPTKSPYCQNVRAYWKGGIVGRNLLTAPVTLATNYTSIISAGTTSQTGSGRTWTNPSDLFGSTGFATASIGGMNPSSSMTLEAQNLGFAVPAGATITGIGFTLYTNGVNGPGASISIQPLQNGSLVGTAQTIPIAFGGKTIAAGGNGNLFGYVWTPTNVNGTGGLGFSVIASIANPLNSVNVTLQQLVVTVYYTSPVQIGGTAPPHSICRLNDSTPNGPPSGYVLVIGAAGLMYVNATEVLSGLSGNPISLIPFRPNTSVQPWLYEGDSAPQGNVTLYTQYLINGQPINFVSNGMNKVRSDNLCYKMGIKEPQLEPLVSTASSSIVTAGILEATAIPWTNYAGQNTDYDYGETNGPPNPGSPNPVDGTAPFIIDVANASFVTITSLTGTATINGNAAATPTTAGPSTGVATNPGHYIMDQGTGTTPPATATVVTGAFTDGAGNVIPAGVVPLYIPSVVDVGAVIGVANAITVPYGAQAFQIGINSTGNTFSANSGSFSLSVTVTTNSLPTVTSTLGQLTAYYWGDSPTSGPVAAYIWKNPDDPSGSGPTRSISDAVGSTSGNSFIFDATFTAGIPSLPGVGSPTVPMEWTVLTPESVASGENAVFSSPITTTYPTNTAYQNFNFCLSGSIYFPQAGQYTFVLTNHDDVIWGIGGGVTLGSATAINQSGSVPTGLSGAGQTITVVGGYALLPRGNYTSGEAGDYVASTVIVNVPAPGVYPIEIDYDYWYHSGRILLLSCTPTPSTNPSNATIIPPLPANVRQETQYRYVYRSSATGATSNPSPESAAETVPVTANTVTSYWSPDPQVDVVDYYRIDSVTASFTYVATGPNDNAGGGTNTPITDSLLDTDLGDQLLNYDNYEPFPSIDLPQKGICSVENGVITWVSGGAIGGSATGFNIRWLAGTTILIGSPTSLAYVFIARPTSTTSVTIPNVPNGTNLVYEIPQPILAAQPLPYL